MTAATAERSVPPLIDKTLSVMAWLPGGLLSFRFQKTPMLRRGIATEVNSAGTAAKLSPLPGGSAGSSVHGIGLSVLAQWAFNETLWHHPTFAHLAALHTEVSMSNSSYGEPYGLDR